MAHFTTGSDERDRMLRRAIGEVLALHEPPNFGVVVDHLPADFDLDLDELNGMLADMRGDAPPETLEKIGSPHANGAAPPSLDTADATPEGEIELHVPPTQENVQRVLHDINEHEARRALDEANAALSAANEKKVAAEINLRNAKADFGSTLRQWQLFAESASDGLSLEQRRQIEARNYLQATAEERARRRGPHGAATRFVQRHMTHGPSRGAYDRTAAARTGYRNFDPRRGPTVVLKTPSER